MLVESLLRRTHMFSSYELIGNCRSELNTEMRFLFASSKVDGDELVKLVISPIDDEKETSRIKGCVIKVLRTLKKEGIIQFYVNNEGFSVNSTEASFLLNKYGDYINVEALDQICVYVKL